MSLVTFLIRRARRYVNVEAVVADTIVPAATYFTHDDVGSQTTRELINENIPTFEEVYDLKDSYPVRQIRQELVARVYQIALPLPVKLALEVYDIYDYFANN